MKSLFCLLFVFSALACGDVEPLEFDQYDASQVDGLWHRNAPNYNWTWYFSDGLMTQSVYDFGQKIIENGYAYSASHDTLRLIRLIDFGSFGPVDTIYYKIYFFTPDSFSATQLKPFGLVHHLVRF